MTFIVEDTARAVVHSSGDELQQHFDVLLAAGAEHFDQVRFRFIEAMFNNAINHRESVRALLKDKILAAIASYIDDFNTAKREALQSLTTTRQLFPDDADMLQSLFEQARFSQLQTLSDSLHEQEQRAHPSALETLTDELGQTEEDQDSPQIGFVFDDFLRQQEQQAMQSLAPERDKTATRKPETSSARKSGDNNAMPELKSARLMRESFGKINADKLVTQMIKKGPENPGPLNPHSLAIKALTDMRDLSPQYLKRFISSIDTLLWMEQAEQKLSSEKSKKGDSTKKKSNKRQS